jgi:DNA-damage-inducible protein J
MSTALIQVRIDEQLKDDVVALYESMGIDISTAIRIFFKKSLADGGIPFSMRTTGSSYTSSVGIETLTRLRRQAIDSGIVDMSLDDINVEINAARADRKL